MTVSRTCRHPGPELPLYWGFSALTTLNAAQVQALTYTRTADDKLGDYEFTEAGASRYMWVAIPDSFGEVITFKTNNLNLSMVTSSVTLTIAGESVLYDLYRSPELQNGSGIVLEAN